MDEETQYFAWTEGNNTDAAYVRYDSIDLQAEPVVVTVFGTERAPSRPCPLAYMPTLIEACLARKITAEQAAALVTHKRGRQ